MSVHEDTAVGSEYQIRGAGHHEGTRLPQGTRDSRSRCQKWRIHSETWRGRRQPPHLAGPKSGSWFTPTTRSHVGIQIQGVAKWDGDHTLALTPTGSQAIPPAATQNRRPWEARTVRSHKPAGGLLWYASCVCSLAVKATISSNSVPGVSH